MKRLIVFDLDGTLALSKSALDSEMAVLMTRLLEVAHVAIISGGGWPQFQQQVLGMLAPGDHLAQLSLLPTCGTQFYSYTGTWEQQYADDLSADEKSEIVRELERAVSEAGFTPEQTWGERIEDRGSQITFSALGQQAPLEAKETWDPDFAKRQQIKTLLDSKLGGFSVRLGGTTSIDVTKPGIDKAYGIRKLRDILGISIAEMVFVGDALFPGGNDYPAKEAGVASIQVNGPSETKRVIETAIAFLEAQD